MPANEASSVTTALNNKWGKKGNPLSGFSEWFTELISDIEPDLIVGIARSAIRLFQVSGDNPLLGGRRFISQHAIPFMNDEDLSRKRVLLFDDSVIYGSVMSKLAKYIESRGAIPFYAAYAVDRHNFWGERLGVSDLGKPSPHAHLTIRYRHRLWQDEIRRHHAVLVRAVLRTPLDYNLEFPSFRLIMPEYCRGDIPFFCHLLRGIPGLRTLEEVSTPASSSQDIHRFTALLDRGIPGALEADGLVCRPYSKARFTFVPVLGEIRFTPVVQLSIADRLTHETVAFRNERIQSLWKRLRPPTHLNDPFYHQSLLRLLTAFCAIVSAEETIRAIAQCFFPHRRLSNAEFLAEDTELVLGEPNAKALMGVWARIHKLNKPPTYEETLFSSLQKSECPNATALRASIKDAWTGRPDLRPTRLESIHESVGKILLTLQHITDSSEARQRNSSAERLEVGFTFESFRSLLADLGRNVSEDEVSMAIDSCIDSALAVPRIVNEGGFWFRAFYSGEDTNDQDLLQFKRGIQAAYSDFLKTRGKPLTRFDMHKLCVCIKDILPWVPISTKNATFGRVAVIGMDEDGILEWLTDEDAGPFKSILQDNQQILVLNDAFKAPVQPTWSPTHTRDFFDAFQYIAKAFSNLSSEAKLLLSTCRSQRYTFNAVAFELHKWSGRERDSFG